MAWMVQRAAFTEKEPPMNARVMLLLCAFPAAACRGSDNPNDTMMSTTSTSKVESTASAVSNPGVADQSKNADNTKINDRDRHGAPTPMDQGNSGAETDITASIRRGIMDDKSLSFTAKNVKVVTEGTKVTLRGPVNDGKERSTIESLATKTPGVTAVDNQLEVKK